MRLLLPLLLFLHLTQTPQVSGVGINYGTLGNNLPRPKKVAQLLQSTVITKVKIYDTNPEILSAFSNSGIDLIVAVENSQVANLSSSPSAASDWLSSRVAPFLPATSVVSIAVGNEYLTTEDLDPNALPKAMQNLHSALLSRGLHRKIKVTTPHSMAVLASSFPPSSATFAATLLPPITSIVAFLADTNAPFMVNAYPYFAYRDSPKTIDLNYALLGNNTTTTTGAVTDNGLTYTNMLDAQIDAVRYAIGSLGFGNRSIRVAVSESGWPSKGDPAATPENARRYNARLVEKAQSSKGTPMKPSETIEIWLFALFNENRKEGGESERNFGIFNPDGSRVYDVDLRCEFCSKAELGEMRAKGPSVWCVAKPHADEKVMKGVLDFCCGGGGVDCSEIKENGGCFAPGNVHAHASYAMNAYYQMHGRNYWNCDFKGTALVTFTDPSYGRCRYAQQ